MSQAHQDTPDATPATTTNTFTTLTRRITMEMVVVAGGQQEGTGRAGAGQGFKTCAVSGLGTFFE